jgi:uncharacterized protein (TIGR01777 family)
MTTPGNQPDRGGIAVISGASGLIGSHLSAALAASGFTVRRLVRRRAVQPPDEISWDPEQGTVDARALEGADVIVNLAGENIGQRWSEQRKRRIRNSRVRGTAALVTAIARFEHRPRVLFNASAMGIYGSRGDEVLDETSTHGSDFLASVCEEWEAATRPAAAAGIRVVIGRNGLVLAPDGGALGRMLPIFRLGLGGRVGSGRQWTSWIALADIVRAILFLIDNEDARGAVNLVAPNPVENAEFARTLGLVLRRPALFPVPSTVLEMIFGEMATYTLLASQRIRPKRLLELGFEFERSTLEAALRAELGAAGSA